MDELEHYLDGVCRWLGGAKLLREHVRQELREHLLDAAGRYGREGLSESAALARAIDDFGGPDEMRSELEAAYGHRLMAVVIDKIGGWKQKTVAARWLWSAWAHSALTGVIAVQLLLLGGALIKIVPLYIRLIDKGWIDRQEYPIGKFVDLAVWGLNGADLIAAYAPVLVPVLGLAWGWFEWRTRSPNKSLIRLSVLGSIACALTIVSLLGTAALMVPTVLSVEPMNARAPQPTVRSALAELEASVTELDWWAEERDREAIRRGAGREGLKELQRLEQMGLPAPILASAYDQAKRQTMRMLADRAYAAISQLDEMGAAGPALASLNDQERVNTIRAELRSARTSMGDARWQLNTPSPHRGGWDRLATSLRGFHEAYARLQAAMKSEK